MKHCLYTPVSQEVSMKGFMKERLTGVRGVTTVEYAVMLVLVAIAVLAFGTGISDSVTAVFSKLALSLKP